MNIDGQIENKLKQLRLVGMLETLPVRLSQAEENRSGYLDFLMTLVEDEYERRQSRQLLKRLKGAGFEEEKTLEGFNFSFNPEIPVQKVKQLANCAYLERRENIFLLGPVGVGKTHIAQALGHTACRMGYEVLFCKAVKMFRDLNGGRADNSFENKIKRYTSVELLIIDDFGLKPLTSIHADDFHEVVTERYLKHSTIFTSNRTIEEWQVLFPDPIIANSIMDRIAHNGHQIIMTGESYRTKGKTNLKKVDEEKGGE
ncbi:MAG: ATP-binding protein [Candidatus Omnitrophica bacterium]|nr:ATP-binding protein [Candidatus Omnitrophota bacterium]